MGRTRSVPAGATSLSGFLTVGQGGFTPYRLMKMLHQDRVQLNSWAGGLNLRDSAVEIKVNETRDALNVTIDPRGGIAKRTGLEKANPAGALASASKIGWYWATAGGIVVQDGLAIKFSTDKITWTTLGSATTTARVAFADFGGELVVAHPVDGVYTATTVAASLTLRNATAKGNTVYVWQNKVFVSGLTSRVWFSNAGDAHTFTTASDWVDIRDKDDTPVSALGGGQGGDYLGRAGLLAFKGSSPTAESTYRIISATSGAYVTLDYTVGAVGPMAVCSLHGKTAFASSRGIYVTDGVHAPVCVSDRVEPFFRPGQLNYALLSGVCAGVYRDRMVFSFPWGTAAAANTRSLEYHPSEGWIMAHSIGVGWFTTWGKQTQLLYGGGTAAAGWIYEVFKGGSDDGTAIASHYLGKFIEPAGGRICQFLKTRFHGRGTVTVEERTDYSEAQGETDQIVFEVGGFVWNAFVWNDGSVWGPLAHEGIADVYVNQRAKALAFYFSETSSLTSSGPAVLGDGAAETEGAWAIYSADVGLLPVEGA